MSNSDYWIPLSAAVKDFINEVRDARSKAATEQSSDDLSPSDGILSWLGGGRLKARLSDGTELPCDFWQAPQARRIALTGVLSVRERRAARVEVLALQFVDMVDEYRATAKSRAAADLRTVAERRADDDKPKPKLHLSDYGDVRSEPDGEIRRIREEEMATYERLIAEGKINRPEPPVSVLAEARARRDALRQCADRPQSIDAEILEAEVRTEPTEVNAVIPRSAEVIFYSTGLAGKPSSWHLVEEECRRRYAVGERYPGSRGESRAASARVLQGWLKSQHPKAPPMSEKALTNRLSGLLSALEQSAVTPITS